MVCFLTGRTFFWRKLHSLCGIIPLGLFLLEHFFTNSLVTVGPEAFDAGVRLLHSLPYLWLWELLLIFLPLAFHGIYGAIIILQARTNAVRYRYYANWMFYLQRVTAIILVVFVFWHVVTLRFGLASAGAEINFGMMQEFVKSLVTPASFALIFLGFLAAVLHFSNGLRTFLISWGITIGSSAQRAVTLICWIVFLGFVAAGINSVLHFLG